MHVLQYPSYLNVVDVCSLSNVDIPFLKHYLPGKFQPLTNVLYIYIYIYICTYNKLLLAGDFNAISTEKAIDEFFTRTISNALLMIKHVLKTLKPYVVLIFFSSIFLTAFKIQGYLIICFKVHLYAEPRVIQYRCYISFRYELMDRLSTVSGYNEFNDVCGSSK